MKKAHRCPGCRTRRVSLLSLINHALKTGHAACLCGGYDYPHRPGSPCCEANPTATYHRAARAGASDEDLIEVALDLAWHSPGKAMTEFP